MLLKQKLFSKRLAESINRYHNNALTTAQVIEELIALAKQIRSEIEERGKSGLTDDEVAFYEALSENESAVEVMGNKKLKLIAKELLNQFIPMQQLTGITVIWHELKFV